MPEANTRLLETAIDREPIKVAMQKGYEVHRLSPKDIVDKADYAEGYRFRISRTVRGKPYPDIVMARSEKEIATFLKREMFANPNPEAVPEAPLTEALIKEGDEIVTKAEAIEPTNASVVKFRELVNQAKEATGETQRQVLIQMEALEAEVRTIAKLPAVEEVKGGNPLPEIDDLLPMSPSEGPPLPKVLGLKWPWKE